MDSKSKLEDYEPLTRAKGSEKSYEGRYASDPGFQTEWKRKESAEPDPVVATEIPHAATVAPPAAAPPPTPVPVAKTFPKPPPKPLIQRGHGLTVLGLFLFTFVLYFRPYELIPSLAFLSNIAFWLALFTVVVYLPTQFALEGAITVKVPEVLFVFALAVWAFLSIPFAVDRTIAFNSVIDYTKVVVIFVVIVNVIRTEKRLKALLALSIFAGIVSSIYAISDYSSGNLALGMLRIRGFVGNLFDNPNDLALHLVTMVPIVLGLAFGSRATYKKILLVGMALLFVGGIISTTSRGGLLGLGAVMAVLGWKLARQYRVVVAGLGLSVAIGIALFGPGGLKSRIAAGNDGSAINRTDDLKRSIFLSTRHPLFGLGMSCYPLYSNTAHATHNAYTQVSVELGAPALVFYLLFLLTPIRGLIRIRNHAPPGKGRRPIDYMIIGLEASLIGYMVTSFFLSVAFLWYAYYLVGYAIVIRRLAERNALTGLDSRSLATNEGRNVPRVKPVMAGDSV